MSVSPLLSRVYDGEMEKKMSVSPLLSSSHDGEVQRLAKSSHSLQLAALID